MNIYWVPGASAGGFVAAHSDDCSPIFCPLHLHFWDWSERQWYWKLANKSKEGKGLFEKYRQLVHVVMQNKTSWLLLNLMHFWRGDDRAKWLNRTCDDLTGLDCAGGDAIRQCGGRDTGSRPHVHPVHDLKGWDYALTLISTEDGPKWTSRSPFAFVLHGRLCLCCWRSSLSVVKRSCRSASHDSSRVLKAGGGRRETGQRGGGREPGEAGGRWAAGGLGLERPVTAHRTATRRKAERK